MKLALLFLAMTTTVSLANTIDYREVIDRTSSEFQQLNAIGIVSESGLSFDGTGFLVSSCTVLTNKHVIKENISEVQVGDIVTFKVGQSGDKENPFTHSSSGEVVAFGKEEVRSDDWALVKLDEAFGDEVGFIEIYQMESRVHAGKDVITAGFPFDLTDRGTNLMNLYADLNCKSKGAGAQNEMVHTCQTTGGQSGSPILMKSSNGKYYAIGMVQGIIGSGMDRGQLEGSYNYGVNFTSGKKSNYKSFGDRLVAALNEIECSN